LFNFCLVKPGLNRSHLGVDSNRFL
jgi:hypothetical protein